jgi:hypothetical protein
MMKTNHFNYGQIVNCAGLAAMDGCAREDLVTGQRFGTAERQDRNRRGNSYENLAPCTPGDTPRKI